MSRTEFRLPEELLAWLKKRAAEDHRSMNSQAIYFLEKMRGSEK